MRLRDLFWGGTLRIGGYQPISTGSGKKGTPPKNPNGDKVDAKTAINNMPLALIKGTPEYEDAVVFNDAMRIIQLHSVVESKAARAALGEALYYLHSRSKCMDKHHFRILKELSDEKQLEFYTESIKERKTYGGPFIG